MWWEWIVKFYIVLWTAGTFLLAVLLVIDAIKQRFLYPLAEVFLPLSALFWFGCWRAFSLHRWALIAVCIFGWLLTALLSAHTSLPGAWDNPKDQGPFHHVLLDTLLAIALFLIYWLSIALFSIALVFGWKHGLSGF